MTRETIYPYRTFAEILRLSLEPLQDSVEVTESGDALAYGLDPDVPRLDLSVEVVVPDHLLEALVPPEEHDDMPVVVELLGESITSRRRAAWHLASTDRSNFTTIVELDRNDYRGTLLLEAVAIRTRAAAPAMPEFAPDVGSRLAWSAPLKVHFDEPAERVGHHLEVTWTSFSQGDPWLRRHAASLFAIRPTDPPVLLLNEDAMPGVRPVLDSRGTTGIRARARDATFNMIVHQVWSSLIAEAVHDLSVSVTVDDEDMQTEDPLASLPAFQAGVLHLWAPLLFPEGNRADALTELLAVLRSGNSAEILLRRLPNAIQERMQTPGALRGLIREMT